MYFFNVNALARDLKNDKVTESEKAKYLFGTLLIETLAIFPSSRDFSLIKIFASIFGLLILVISFYLCFKANKKGDNKDFVSRFISLSFPLLLLLVGVIILLGIVLFLAMSVAGTFREAQFAEFLQIITLPLSPLYYLILYRKIKFVAQKQSV